MWYNSEWLVTICLTFNVSKGYDLCHNIKAHSMISDVQHCIIYYVNALVTSMNSLLMYTAAHSYRPKINNQHQVTPSNTKA